MRSFIAILKLIAFSIWTLPLAFTQLCIGYFVKDKNSAYYLPYIWHKGVCTIFGLHFRIEGFPSLNERTLFVSNHLSYLDIFILGAILKASFVAKREVAGWPVIGFLAKLQQTAFIDRSRHAAGREKDSLNGMINSGKSLILFPEATSTNGHDVVPFRSSFFSLAYENEENTVHLSIQPVTFRLDGVNGFEQLSKQSDRDLYAWYGDMTLTPHLWNFLKSKGALVTVIFHEIKTPDQYEDRKILAESCCEEVKKGLSMPKVA